MTCIPFPAYNVDKGLTPQNNNFCSILHCDLEFTQNLGLTRTPCYRVGLINYSNSQSPTYYFLSSSTFCYPDTSNEGNGSENQQDDSSQQHAIQGVISLANQMYGEGDWRIASVIDATTPSGEACWYIGAINYSKSQSPTYYFYSSDSFTYADEEVNGYYNN